MLASKALGIRRTRQDDWFDPILDVDTRLFVDPFLIFKEKRAPWHSAHARLIAHFDQAFQLVAQSGLNSKALAYQKAINMLLFPEPSEFCLGYTSEGTAGLGSGRGFARLIAGAISDAVRRGIKHPRHFEELGILHEGIGADRISDITCTILKPDLISYTKTIAARHGIATRRHSIYAAEFDQHRKRFRTTTVAVPTNPTNGKPLLLVPKRFLDTLPALNADDWWDHYENHQLRTDLNYEIMGKVSKAIIVRTARQNIGLVRAWAKQKEARPAEGYDFARDPKGVVLWEEAANEYTESHPLKIKPPSDEAEFISVIEALMEQVRLFIEEQGGWYLLWDRAKEKPELAAQLVFYGIARNYCTANNVVIDREPDLGRGPVDFKFSNGYVRRAHLEVKKLHNGKFWNGLDEQLPSYLASDQVTLGWFLAVRYRDGKEWDEREAKLPGRVARAAQRHGRSLRHARIDARPKKSASKL